MERIKPLKKFGQNYLNDKNVLRKITDELAPRSGDNLLEIGPGTGSLTTFLYEANENLNAVEIDFRVIDVLKNRFPKMNIIQDDFMETDLTRFIFDNKKKLRITGNIPYNLTSPIIFKIIKNSRLISDAVLLVQYEVARRMTARKGSKDYGILSVLLDYFTEIKYCFKVSPKVFYPSPKVSSAVVHIFIKKEFVPETDTIFINTVKAAFGKRRKTLKNSLGSSIFADINFLDSGIDLSKRAEELDTKDFVKLSRYILSVSGI